MREYNEMMQAIDLLQLSAEARSALMRKITDYHNSTNCANCEQRWADRKMLDNKTNGLKKAVKQLRNQLIRVRLCNCCGRCSSCIVLKETEGLQ